MSNNPVVLYRREILNHYGWNCIYCGKELTEQETELDHIVPRTKGGKSRLSNAIPSCMLCNRRKNNKPPHFAIQLCFSLTRYRVFPKVFNKLKKKPNKLRKGARLV